MFGKKDKIRVGVVGVGVLGHHHTRLYKANPDVELVGVYDVSPGAAADVGKEYGVPAFDTVTALAEQKRKHIMKEAERLLSIGKDMGIARSEYTAVLDRLYGKEDPDDRTEKS